MERVAVDSHASRVALIEAAVIAWPKSPGEIW
jgi:hypothetical protein